MVRILLVEDHAAFRQAFAVAIDREPDLTVIGQAGSLAEARAILDELDGLDVAVIDLALPDGDGAELIGYLHKTCPRALSLVLTASLDPTELARAVEAGAAGVLHKSVALDEITRSMRQLGDGDWLLSPRDIVDMLHSAYQDREHQHEIQAMIAQLTRREREVLEALALGLDSKEIAQRLHVTLETERTHMVNILSKLSVHNRLQALVFAVRHHVVEIH